jgi:hypothetical protein
MRFNISGMTQEDSGMDLVFVALVLSFFALTAGLIRLCDRLEPAR